MPLNAVNGEYFGGRLGPKSVLIYGSRLDNSREMMSVRRLSWWMQHGRKENNEDNSSKSVKNPLKSERQFRLTKAVHIH